MRRDDLRQARAFRSWYKTDDPPVFAGTTAFSVSTAVLSDLKTKGQADIVRMAPHTIPWPRSHNDSAAGNATPARHAGHT